MHAEEPPSAPELDAVAVAAEQQLRALASEDPLDAGPLVEALAYAATAAIASGQPIAEIARAEQRGQQQARAARAICSRDLLARVERAARRRRGAEYDLHQAVARTARLGLPQREIAAAARVAAGTIHAIVEQAVAILDRLLHDAEILTINGPSWRLRGRGELFAEDGRTAQNGENSPTDTPRHPRRGPQKGAHDAD